MSLLRRIFVLAVLGSVLAPASGQAFSKAMWGPVFRGGVSQFPIYHQLGVSIYETNLYWTDAAPQRPRHPTDPLDAAYRWPAEIDQALVQASRFHIRVSVQLIGAPRWANGGRPWNWAPRHSADFAAFAMAAARRYPGVHLWMIWGEPDRKHNFQPLVSARPGTRLNRIQQAAPHKYAQMLDAAYGALKQVNPSHSVIGGCTFTTGDIDTEQWIRNLRLPNGRAPRMDLYAHNPFGATDPSFSAPPSPGGSVQFSDLPRLARWIDRYLQPGLRIFISEYTIPTAPDNEFPFYVDPPVAARWIRDALHLSRGWKRIYALGWVNLYDNPPISYGGLFDQSGARKPGFAAFAKG